MREFKSTFTGGHDLRLDDIGFIQQAYKELIDEIMSSDFLKSGIANPANPFVLRGITQTGNTFTRGSIFWNGEIYLVDDQSITGSGTLYWEKIVTYSPANVTYEDGQVRQVHEIRKLRPTYTNPGTNGFTNAVLQRYVNPLMSNIGEIVGFPEAMNPPSMFYLPCEANSNIVVNTDPNYSVLKSILPEFEFNFLDVQIGTFGGGINILALAIDGDYSINPTNMPLNLLCEIEEIQDPSFVLDPSQQYQIKYITINQPGMSPSENVTGYFLCNSDGNPITYVVATPTATEGKIFVISGIPTIENSNETKYYIRAN